jgi:hypothetical protein
LTQSLVNPLNFTFGFAAAVAFVAPVALVVGGGGG